MAGLVAPILIEGNYAPQTSSRRPLPFPSISYSQPPAKRLTRPESGGGACLLQIPGEPALAGDRSSLLAPPSTSNSSFDRRHHSEPGAGELRDWPALIVLPRALPSLLPTSHPVPDFTSRPDQSHAHARSCIRWRPIQRVCVPGSFFGRSMYPPDLQRGGPFPRAAVTSSEVAFDSTAIQTAFHSDGSNMASQSMSGQLRPKRHTNSVRHATIKYSPTAGKTRSMCSKRWCYEIDSPIPEFGTELQ